MDTNHVDTGRNRAHDRSDQHADRAPRYVKLLGPIATFLLAARVPLGFNGLITIRGRKSGIDRTIPLAIIDVAGRRWVWSPWGDVQWVQNLRAAGRATITVRGRKEEVTATELDATQRVDFFRDVFGSCRAQHAVRQDVRPLPRRRGCRRSGRGSRRSMRLRAPRRAMRRRLRADGCGRAPSTCDGAFADAILPITVTTGVLREVPRWHR